MSSYKKHFIYSQALFDNLKKEYKALLSNAHSYPYNLMMFATFIFGELAWLDSKESIKLLNWFFFEKGYDPGSYVTNTCFKENSASADVNLKKSTADHKKTSASASYLKQDLSAMNYDVYQKHVMPYLSASDIRNLDQTSKTMLSKKTQNFKIDPYIKSIKLSLQSLSPEFLIERLDELIPDDITKQIIARDILETLNYRQYINLTSLSLKNVQESDVYEKIIGNSPIIPPGSYEEHQNPKFSNLDILNLIFGYYEDQEENLRKEFEKIINLTKKFYIKHFKDVFEYIFYNLRDKKDAIRMLENMISRMKNDLLDYHFRNDDYKRIVEKVSKINVGLPDERRYEYLYRGAQKCIDSIIKLEKVKNNVLWFSDIDLLFEVASILKVLF